MVARYKKGDPEPSMIPIWISLMILWVMAVMFLPAWILLLMIGGFISVYISLNAI